MPYELKINHGNDNQDCLIIALGRVFDPVLSDVEAKERGWAEIESGILVERDFNRLQILYLSLYFTYSNDILFKNNKLPEQAPETLEELKNSLMLLVEAIKTSSNLTKGLELIDALPENFLQQHHVILVNKEALEHRGGVGHLYLQTHHWVAQGISPQFFVQNGGHFSSVMPSLIPQGGFSDLEQGQFEHEFIGLMNGPLGEATSYQLELQPELDGREELPEVSYTKDQLDRDLAEYIVPDTASNFGCSDVEQGDELDDCESFVKRTKSKYEAFDTHHDRYNQLPEQHQDSLAEKYRAVRATQEQLDFEMALRLQLEEVESFKQKKPERNIQVNGRESLLFFLQQYEDNDYCVKDCGVTPGM
ncbi:hypothetical protein AVI51_06425 [Piscirickettsia salmonis]|uniref:hypothetical protein n=1 Tax=Piscirickettsia salmonis TaxID=1238 RepID=UPI0006BCFABA|nr:hypothetical protein [Piscirickettsia salmonis]ALA25724.1 general glycosylation pathway protein [Piscirickettsia salmonis]APS43213.1 hypothetical protein AVI48_01655 [Piscirickettsia salmonis]APS46562.1 hypothetical protein AVI49_02255 [Piscirickettsia salmonis]APS50531.1 hypothetical protein AVI50_06500 [Piscirickettsia salmonis]APS53734.1 hypothetical protein AVI51_06425 [Piscirickettsia salmonis]